MARRISQHSRDKMGKVGRKAFLPDLKEWTEICALYPYDKNIFKHFEISAETFYAFIDKERCVEEAGKKSAYLEALKKGRYKNREIALNSLIFGAQNGDPACVIFAAKTYGGLMEAKDVNMIDLKRKELKFKMDLQNKQFLTSLSEKFNLSYEQLDEFANKYFKESKLDDI